MTSGGGRRAVMVLRFNRALLRLHRLFVGGRAAQAPRHVGLRSCDGLHRALGTSVQLRMISEENPHSSQTDSEHQDPGSSSYSDESAGKGKGFESEDQLRQQLLSAALKSVPKFGWSVEAIAEGAKVLELSPAIAGMFGHSPGDLVLHFITHCNRQLSQTLTEQQRRVQLGQEEAKKTDVFVRDAVESRLRMVIPYLDSWPQAMSLLLMPENVGESVRSLSEMVDEIWYHAGDRSTDSNWYTKRILLAGIYSSTELVLVQDTSHDYESTWAFLQHRVDDVVSLAHSARQAELTRKAVFQGLTGAAVTMKNLTGIGQGR